MSDKIFVVQKHNAKNLHYDFRLAISGMLASWAVPKGPSMNPSVKRLAIQVEDHHMNYANFEGIIPEPQYGAGTVMVWDKGTYKNLSDDSIAECLKNGKIEFNLSGKKLKGDFVIFKTKGYSKKDNTWLLVKQDDQYANYKNDILKDKPKSVLSNKTIEELEKDK